MKMVIYTFYVEPIPDLRNPLETDGCSSVSGGHGWPNIGLGGDEFAAVLPDCGLTNANNVGHRFLETIQNPLNLKGLPKELVKKVSISVGMACIPDHTSDVEELIRIADKAMYASKTAGRNQFQLAQVSKKKVSK